MLQVSWGWLRMMSEPFTVKYLVKSSSSTIKCFHSFDILINMRGKDVVELYTSLQRQGVQIWIDGGWGVDVLLGQQTRPHKDLDIVIQQKDLPKLRELLEQRKYKEIEIDQARPHNFVLADDNGFEIDVHVIVLDEKGNGMYGPAENGDTYPADSLTGKGIIESQKIKCISPEWMVKFHSGYDLKEKDFLDVSALCSRFGMDLPDEYKRFNKPVSDSNN